MIVARKQELELEDVAGGKELEKIREFTQEPKKASEGEIPRDVKFSKAQILRSKALTFNKDVLKVLLSDEELYTVDEVESIVSDFNKKEVK